MKISIIVAMDLHGGIGIDNRLPWRLSTDLKRFRELTMGHHLLLGRRTYDSIGRPLPGRKMVVLTRTADYAPPNVEVAHSLSDAIDVAKNSGESELFIGGGADIYALTLPLAHRIYLTRVETSLPTDTVFPEWDCASWSETLVSTHLADEKNEYGYSFLVYDRR
jgi:dihydrofolate reductase